MNITEAQKLINEFKQLAWRRKSELKKIRKELGLDKKYFEVPDVYPDVFH